MIAINLPKDVIHHIPNKKSFVIFYIVYKFIILNFLNYFSVKSQKSFC